MFCLFFDKYFWCLVLLACTQAVFGQVSSFTIEFKNADNQKIELLSRHTDSISALFFIDKFLQKNLLNKGFLAAKILTKDYDAPSKRYKVTYHPGRQYKWLRLGSGNLPQTLLAKSRINLLNYSGALLKWQEYEHLCERVLAVCQNNGLPFASIRLDSIKVDSSHVSAVLNFQKGDFICFDSLTNSEKLPINSVFLARYLRMRKEQAYHESALRKSHLLLRNLPFLEVLKPAEVIFKDNKAYPILYARTRKASEIDGTLGFMPNEAQSGRILLTGQVRLNLQNILNTGKSIQVFWQQFLPKSPQLDASYAHYNLLNTHIDCFLSFNLLKQDTSFNNIRQKAECLWRWGYHSLGVLAGVQSTSTLSRTVVPTDNLPAIANTNYVFYGFKWLFDKRNSPIMPRKGHFIQLESAFGNKKLTNKSLVRQKLLPKNSLQYSATLSAEKYWPIRKNLVGMVHAQGGVMRAAYLLRNDFYRMGGLKTLRGFNENAFFVSEYAILTSEIRLLIAQESFLFAFTSGAYLAALTERDYPYSFGAGLQLNTGTGIFTFAYSLGRSALLEQNLAFSRAKIHFGLVSRF